MTETDPTGALLTAAEMRAIEEAAFAEGRASGLELMDRAARGVVATLLAWRPEFASGPRRALVLAGPGNNGGDGFAVARLLAERGWRVCLRLYGRDPAEIDQLPADAATNARRWALSGPVGAWDDAAIAARIGHGQDDVVVDALFGTGLVRPLRADTRETSDALARAAGRDGGPAVVAVDMPSGVCADSGADLGGGFAADLTVSFHAAKRGHVLCHPGAARSGPDLAGRVVVVEIGLGSATAAGPDCRLVGPPDPARLAKRGGHKYDHGHALVLAGGVARGGAARLAARAALRVGAGLVTLGCPPAALIENAARLDAVMLRAVSGPEALSALAADARVTALCLGPGLGVGQGTRALVTAALAAGQSAVLDADALTSFEETPDALFARLHGGCLLTPHDGEFARLFPDLAATLRAAPEAGPAPSRVDAVRAAAARAGATVLLKGPDTVIAAPDGTAAVHAATGPRAVPWLATAGAGDVLAGLAAGRMARGDTAFAAAGTAAWLHAEAARAAGPGLIAEDLPEALPGVLARLCG